MRLVLDSDVLVHALRVPKGKDLYALHEKASKLFESCIEKKNELFLPSMEKSYQELLATRAKKRACAQDSQWRGSGVPRALK